MGWLILIVLLLVVVVAPIWFVVSAIGSPPASSSSSAVRTREPAQVPIAIPERICRLSGRGRLPIVGEQFYDRNIDAVCAGRLPGVVGDWDSGLRVDAYLVREPSNKHDRNAVVVKMPTRRGLVTVGYIKAAEAKSWHPLLFTLERRSVAPVCQGLVYVSGKRYQIVLRVAPPAEALMSNTLPAGADPLDPGRQAALVGERDHQDTLAGREGETVWATLHRGEFISGTHQGEMALEVQLDGQVAGTLSAKQSERYAVLLDAPEPIVCEMDIFPGKTVTEARVWLPKVD